MRCVSDKGHAAAGEPLERRPREELPLTDALCFTEITAC